jgi:hypothetical protein
MNAEAALVVTMAALVEKTVAANLAEVARYAQAGHRQSYYKIVYHDSAVNEAARAALGRKGYSVENGRVSW